MTLQGLFDALAVWSADQPLCFPAEPFILARRVADLYVEIDRVLDLTDEAWLEVFNGEHHAPEIMQILAKHLFREDHEPA